MVLVVKKRSIGVAIIVALAFFNGGSVAAKNKERSKSPAAAGYSLKGINTVVVTRYAKMSDSRDNPESKRVSVINNKETVARLVKLVNALPATGTMMVKPGDVEFMQASFSGHYDSPATVISIVGGMVQAPADTSFYGGGLPEEKEIYQILSQAKPMPKKGLRVKSAKSVRIEEYDHAFYKTANRSAEIRDPKTVTALLELLNQMPLKGEIFASFAPNIDTTHVFFVDDGGEETAVALYGEGISTTDGSFYAGGLGGELQEKFNRILRAELAKTCPESRYAFDAEGAQSVSVDLRKGDARGFGQEISDPKAIKKIRDLLAKLPAQGNEKISWGDDVEVLTATFSRPGAPKTHIEFYDGHIKAPNIAFYGDGSRPEKSLYELLRRQVKDVQKPISRVSTPKPPSPKGEGRP